MVQNVVLQICDLSLILSAVCYFQKTIEQKSFCFFGIDLHIFIVTMTSTVFFFDALIYFTTFTTFPSSLLIFKDFFRVLGSIY